MIAMALVLDPVLLIADEPTTALDVTTQAEILKLIARAAGRRRAPACCSSPTISAWSPRSPIASPCCAGASWSRWARPSRSCRGPQQAYTRMLISSVPSIHPRASRRAARRARPCCAPRSSARPIAGNVVLPEGARREGRGRRRSRHPPRRDAGHRRRIGLGQVDGGALHRPPDRPDRGQGLPGRHRDRHHVGRQAAPAPPAGADRLPGPLPLDEPAHHGRRFDHRGADELRPAARRGARPRAQADGDGAARSQLARPLSAPVLGRPAPAHLHRPRARHGARAADRRRGGLRARRLGAEAGAASCSTRSASG